MVRRWVAAIACVATLCGFSADEAAQRLNGEWQGPVEGLSINAGAMSGIYIYRGERIAGPFKVEEIVADTVVFSIGAQKLVAHFRGKKDEFEMSQLGRQTSFTIKRVR